VKSFTPAGYARLHSSTTQPLSYRLHPTLQTPIPHNRHPSHRHHPAHPSECPTAILALIPMQNTKVSMIIFRPRILLPSDDSLPIPTYCPHRWRQLNEKCFIRCFDFLYICFCRVHAKTDMLGVASRKRRSVHWCRLETPIEMPKMYVTFYNFLVTNTCLGSSTRTAQTYSDTSNENTIVQLRRVHQRGPDGESPPVAIRQQSLRRHLAALPPLVTSNPEVPKAIPSRRATIYNTPSNTAENTSFGLPAGYPAACAHSDHPFPPHTSTHRQ